MTAMGEEIQDISPQALHALLAQGAVVLTANQRLSRRLGYEYAVHRRAQGDTCWPSPKILPWSAWLLEVWDDALLANAPISDNTAARVVMNPLQTLLLWEQVIRRSHLDKGVLNIQATAAGVAQAWAVLQAWSLPLPRIEDYPSEDAAAFRIWALAFKKQCERARLLDAARLPDLLAELCAQGQLKLPKEIILIGFDQLTPQQSHFLHALQAQHCQVEQRQFPGLQSQSSRVACHDSEDELARAAGWARARLTADAKASIAIVVPDLQARLAQVERVFADVMHPQQILPRAAREQRCFNISLGTPLAAQPMIRAALNILRLAQGRIDAHQLGSLLRSPYTGAGTSEAAGRAQLDVRLRERGDYEVWLADLLGVARRALASDEERELAPRFLQQLESLFVHHRAITGKFFHHQWAERFTGCLRAMGWPGERGLNSNEHQQLQAWQALLDNVSSLDVIAEAVPISTALARLNNLAAEQLFQARTPWRPVQILGLLETSGQRFDHLWVCGMDDESWPGPARPNPWLPLQLQRKHGLPHADAARELIYAKNISAQLSSAALQVVFSHAVWDGDRQRQHSPLLADSPEVAASTLVPADIHLFRNITHTFNDLETLIDSEAPAVPAGPAHGGSGLIAAQAACPFKAYGRYRLDARELEEVSLAPDARQRGLLLHRAMQRLWARLSGSADLQRCSEQALRELIDNAVEPVVSEAAQQKPRTYTPKFVEVEKRVLGALILDWLQCELTRDEFFVTAREQANTVNLAGLELRVIMDRIDRTPGGEKIVLDYKTGRVSVGGWEDERPDAPQLPMYALALDEPPAAVSFAQIRPGEARFVGCGRDDAPLPGVKPEDATQWRERLQSWQKNLSEIAAEYRAGAAQVAPKNRPQTCQYCDLTPLCRIHEAEDVSGNDEENP